MKLSPQQLEQFDREGYLFFPGLFTQPEIKVLLAEVNEFNGPLMFIPGSHRRTGAVS